MKRPKAKRGAFEQDLLDTAHPYAFRAGEQPFPWVEMDLPLPSSKKNNKDLFWVPNKKVPGGKRPYFGKNKQVRRDEDLIRACVAQGLAPLLAATKGRLAWCPDGDVHVVAHHLVPRKLVRIRFYAMGPKPSGVSGRKRDLINFLETILDAVQVHFDKKHGITHTGIYKNDNQVALLSALRVI